MAKQSISVTEAVNQTSHCFGHLRAKGFTRPYGGGELRYHRSDAELYFDRESGKWVCDVYTVVDGARDKLFTRKAAPMLLTVLKSIL